MSERDHASAEFKVYGGVVTQRIRRGSTLIVQDGQLKVRARWWWRLIGRGGRIEGQR